jgi:hypothetical protein
MYCVKTLVYSPVSTNDLQTVYRVYSVQTVNEWVSEWVRIYNRHSPHTAPWHRSQSCGSAACTARCSSGTTRAASPHSAAPSAAMAVEARKTLPHRCPCEWGSEGVGGAVHNAEAVVRQWWQQCMRRVATRLAAAASPTPEGPQWGAGGWEQVSE